MSSPVDLLHSPEAEQERSARPFREVGVVFLRNSEGQLLMTRSHKFPQSWGGFGGGREPGDESLTATAVRELREESGLSLSPESLTFVLETPYDFGEGKVHFFEAMIPSDAAFTLNEQEIAEMRWMSLSEALSVPVFPATDACLKRFLA